MSDMQQLNSWATKDRKILLHLTDDTLKVFNRFMQVGHTANEAGGLLLGTVHGANMLVGEATTPTEADQRSRFHFSRKATGHRALAQARWRASNGLIRYLGEWHTHPQDDPEPSYLDRKEWARLSAQRKDKRPFLAVIVGRKALHVELIFATGLSLKLQPIK